MLRAEVDALGRIVNELLEGMKHVEKALRVSVELNEDLMAKGIKLRQDLDLMSTQVESTAKYLEALTTKVFTIERKVYKLQAEAWPDC